MGVIDRNPAQASDSPTPPSSVTPSGPQGASGSAREPHRAPPTRWRARSVELRRLGRAAVLGSGRQPRVPDALEHIVKVHRGHHPRADLEALRRAYLLAASSHSGQMRKSGEPYITHPLAVTMILAGLGAETTTLVASLLHDTVEDTDVTLEQVGAEFGEEVRYLVDGVTKLEKVDYGAAAEPETFRKMLVATGNDVRVMVIKLADRLHNMRTIRHMKPASQVRIAKVTREVLIPLAERLGVQVIKTELEDIVFATLHPQEYSATRELIERHEAAPQPLHAVAERVRQVLREARIDGEVTIRARHCLSVHRFRRKQGVAPGDLGPFDFARLLVVVEEDADCYAVLGELHTCFTPVIAEFKDFVAAPKFNLYQSLHTAVATPEGGIAEVLVRTRRMHRVAETGVVALGNPHSAANDPEQPADGERGDPTRPGWLSRLLQWQRDAPDTDTFWSALREELAEDRQIAVFTPDGRTVELPAGATCVDAAYALGEQTGHRCIGARVNGRLTALATVLRTGDVLHLLVSSDESSGPSADWMDYARTPAARIAISRWLQAHPQAPAEPPAPARSGEPGRAKRRRRALVGGHGDYRAPAVSVAVPGRPDVQVRLARCCTPVPPDAVTGFVTRGGTVAVHRTECAAVQGMRASGRAPVALDWAHGAGSGLRVTVRAEALGRPRLLADLTEAIAAAGVAIVSAAVEPPKELRVRHTYTVELPAADALQPLMRAMRDVPGVYDVYRVRRSSRAVNAEERG
ncbi:kinase [Wenjunlia vitaminophila]|uniref:Kinase n=1 Tax=Wenjunlia vitaminophila TaxID=76728 RepID=A0A0T6LZG8_WENVI|nr:kinase [Wenjunlia vitaminophila]